MIHFGAGKVALAKSSSPDHPESIPSTHTVASTVTSVPVYPMPPLASMDTRHTWYKNIHAGKKPIYLYALYICYICNLLK